MKLGVSNYGSLCTKSFPIVEYPKQIGEIAGADHTRCFIDLNIWDRLPNGKYKFNPDNAIYLYRWDAFKEEWILGKVNPEFVDRLGEAGREARKQGIQIVISGMTDPVYYKDSPIKGILNQIGYANGKDVIQRGNFPGANWAGIRQYHKDLAAALKQVNMPRVYAVWEPINEAPGWGSIYEEMKDLCADMRGAYRVLQYNPPSLQDDNQEGYNPPAGCFTDWAWPQQLIAGKGGIKVKRVAYHSVFDGAQVTKEIKLIKQHGNLPATILTFSTDGASPGFGFKYPGGISGHYKMRPKWKSKKAAVIKAHVDIARACLQAGAACELQDVQGWTGNEQDVNQPEVREFYEALAKVAA